MNELKLADAKEGLSFDAAIPFVQLLGFELLRTQSGDGESTVVYRPKAEHANSLEVVHGGALMTLLDVAMASAARSQEMTMKILTVEMKTTFMRPAPLSELTCRAKVVHRSATMAFTEATIFNASGQICAAATGTFKYIARLSVRGALKSPASSG